MYGLGTIINSFAIVVGGLLGMLFGRFIGQRHRDALCKACGLAVIFIGAAGAFKGMFSVVDGDIVYGGDFCGNRSNLDHTYKLLSRACSAVYPNGISHHAACDRYVVQSSLSGITSNERNRGSVCINCKFKFGDASRYGRDHDNGIPSVL